MADTKLEILVVDDNRSMRQTLSGIIQEQGHHVTQAEDGYQAMNEVKKTSFDLVFMDIIMPGINGVQVLREIKKIDPEVVVVMMTGFSVEHLVNDAVAEGAISVMYKPFQPAKVMEFVESAFKPQLTVGLTRGDRPRPCGV